MFTNKRECFSILEKPNPSQYIWEGLYRLTYQPKRAKLETHTCLHSIPSHVTELKQMGFCTACISKWYWSPLGCTSTCIPWAPSRSSCIPSSWCDLRPIAPVTAPWHWVIRRTLRSLCRSSWFLFHWIEGPLARLNSFERPLILHPQCQIANYTPTYVVTRYPWGSPL